MILAAGVPLVEGPLVHTQEEAHSLPEEAQLAHHTWAEIHLAVHVVEVDDRLLPDIAEALVYNYYQHLWPMTVEPDVAAAYDHMLMVLHQKDCRSLVVVVVVVVALVDIEMVGRVEVVDKVGEAFEEQNKAAVQLVWAHSHLGVGHFEG
jgi:hypothetical protein